MGEEDEREFYQQPEQKRKRPRPFLLLRSAGARSRIQKSFKRNSPLKLIIHSPFFKSERQEILPQSNEQAFTHLSSQSVLCVRA
jgi:hypothetical protein